MSEHTHYWLCETDGREAHALPYQANDTEAHICGATGYMRARLVGRTTAMKAAPNSPCFRHDPRRPGHRQLVPVITYNAPDADPFEAPMPAHLPRVGEYVYLPHCNDGRYIVAEIERYAGSGDVVIQLDAVTLGERPDGESDPHAELIANLHEILWPAEEPDRAWSADTLDQIAALLEQKGAKVPAPNTTLDRGDLSVAESSNPQRETINRVRGGRLISAEPDLAQWRGVFGFQCKAFPVAGKSFECTVVATRDAETVTLQPCDIDGKAKGHPVTLNVCDVDLWVH